MEQIPPQVCLRRKSTSRTHPTLDNFLFSLLGGNTFGGRNMVTAPNLVYN